MRGVVLQVENLIMRADCAKKVDVEALAVYGEAHMDIAFKPAKYRVARPSMSPKRDENDVVNVYPSGKIVALAAKSVDRAEANMRAVFRRLGAPPPGAAVQYVVMSGVLFGDYDVYRAVPLLEKSYEVSMDSAVFTGYFVRDGEGVCVQVFASNGKPDGGRTSLLCRGPTVEAIRKTVGGVYEKVVEANGAGEEGARARARAVDGEAATAGAAASGAASGPAAAARTGGSA